MDHITRKFRDRNPRCFRKEGEFRSKIEDFDILKLKELCEQQHKKENYESALLFYKRAIRLAKQLGDKVDAAEMTTLYLNQAQSFLKLDRFHEAYEAAKNASEIDANNENIFYR